MATGIDTFSPFPPSFFFYVIVSPGSQVRSIFSFPLPSFFFSLLLSEKRGREKGDTILVSPPPFLCPWRRKGARETPTPARSVLGRFFFVFSPSTKEDNTRRTLDEAPRLLSFLFFFFFS